MEKLLNAYLADLIVESHKLQGFHWYVKGKEFFWAHAKFEELYAEVGLLVDETAEAMLMSGMSPITTMKDIAAAATIKEPKASFVVAMDAIAEIADDYDHLFESIRTIKEQAEKDGDDVLSVKADAQIETLAKTCWMLRQCLK